MTSSRFGEGSSGFAICLSDTRLRDFQDIPEFRAQNEKAAVKFRCHRTHWLASRDAAQSSKNVF